MNFCVKRAEEGYRNELNHDSDCSRSKTSRRPLFTGCVIENGICSGLTVIRG